MTELQRLLYKERGLPYEVTSIIEDHRMAPFKSFLENDCLALHFACLLRLSKLGKIYRLPNIGGVKIRDSNDRANRIMLGVFNDIIEEVIAGVNKYHSFEDRHEEYKDLIEAIRTPLK